MSIYLPDKSYGNPGPGEGVTGDTDGTTAEKIHVHLNTKHKEN